MEGEAHGRQVDPVHPRSAQLALEALRRSAFSTPRLREPFRKNHIFGPVFETCIGFC